MVKKKVQEDLFIKCPKCQYSVYKKELEENLWVCTKCDYYFRLDSKKRLDLLIDEDSFKEYDGMMPEMKDGALIIDDINHYESEKLIEKVKPDIFCAGIKEKYVVEKMGVPCKQLHSYDYGGPYAGFQGAINFYEEIDRMVNAKVWKMTKAPWEESD